MKNLYIVGGTMGVGKTTVCQILKKKLTNSAFLDGDWCWDLHPFQVNDETKNMVLNNICCLLNNYIHCSVISNIIFCWVLHDQSIISAILSELDCINCNVRIISLICDEDALVRRLQKDVNAGLRCSDIIEKSIGRLPLYAQLETSKIDVSDLSAEEAAEIIAQL